MTTPDAASETQDLWSVQLATGEVCEMTLDQLDEAFQEGRIDEHTAILQHGSDQWSTLGNLAGIDGEEPAPPAAPETEAPPAIGAAPAAIEPAIPQAAIPQAAIPFAAPAPVSALPAPLAAAAGFNDLPSIRPVAADVGAYDDLDAAALRPKRGKLIAMGAVAAGILLGVGLAFSSINSAPDAPVAATSTVAVGLPPVVAAPPPPPAVEPPSVAAATPAASSADARLSDDQKKTLLDADKNRQKKSAARAANGVSHTNTKSKSVFHKGGNKFDPLNSSL